uniref:Uncharacterized protein n=1 Tax=Rhizochromulina marina TaxID=1034831 RepID=A0A7S2WH08_9STRA|mmetsp:Transcript_24075/g.70585  ORF Transcript_24075/g.70585 Transcript_24075/m.70585 type:complete len:722 (+) Transcript_24075:79-2244(+)|eukprot:CAMPEP_0118962330 /NCGR_PEP_ID=MMETSP1173-20130426/707_1 /TAXON_ID=1034831 /ORGANISM="Rhizochromulina marina cf, Strain CCMP1243" /LENGTH=721 /DNA_ID=CAMNT_0006910579 /DNA_START=21 /DNA_END=2186 /DNA_ORIENTATION=-
MTDAVMADISWRYGQTAPKNMDETMDLAAKAKEEGNSAFRKKDYSRAIAFYRTGLSKLRLAKSKFPSAGSKSLELELSLHLNTAMCLVKTCQWEEAIGSASAALRVDASSAKARLYRARALAASSHRPDGLQRALEDLRAAASVAPADKTIQNELALVQARASKAESASATSVPTGGSRDAGQDLADQEEEQEADEKLRKAFKAKGQVLFHDERSSQPRSTGASSGTSSAPPVLLPGGVRMEDLPPEVARQLMAGKQPLVPDGTEQAHSYPAAPPPPPPPPQVGPEEDEEDLSDLLGYKKRDDGIKVPSWSHSSGEGNTTVLPVAPPQKLAVEGDPLPMPAPSVGYNRGYKERNMTEWCVRELVREVLEPFAFVLPEGGGRFRTFHPEPRDVSGEALMAGLLGKWDHTLDFSISIPWEAKIGEPRTTTVTVQGKQQKMFMGIPTYRGRLRYADVSHLSEPEDYDVEISWMEGAKAEMPTGEAMQHLRALINNKQAGLQVLMIRRFQRFLEKYRSISNPQEAIDSLSQPLPPPGTEDGTAVPPQLVPEPWEFTRVADLEAVPEKAGDQLAGQEEGQERSQEPAEDGSSEKASDVFKTTKLLNYMDQLQQEGYAVFMGEADKAEAAAEPVPASGDGKKEDALDYSRFNAVEVGEEEEGLSSGDIGEPTDDPEELLRRLEQHELWQVVMEIAEGDGEKALELIQNPEQLQSHPKIKEMFPEEGR